MAPRGTRFKYKVLGNKIVKTDGTEDVASVQLAGGRATVTGSADIVTGMSNVYAAFVNVRRKTSTAMWGEALFNTGATTKVGGLADGSIKIKVLASWDSATHAITESSDAASVDWLALGV